MSKDIDILLCVAMAEELDIVAEELGGGLVHEEMPDHALTIYYKTISSCVSQTEFNVAIVSAGKMGNTRSAGVTSAVLEKLNPVDLVVLGIAGSLTNDMAPGDVFVPDSVKEYLANSAGIGEENWSFQLSGNEYRTSQRLLNRIQNFKHTQSTIYKKWQENTRENRDVLISNEMEAALKAAALAERRACQLFAGDDRKLASGAAVGKGKAFVDWLTRDVDRKHAAVEMETAGVFDAASLRTNSPRTVAIRGISDFADERKKEIEATAKVKLRELSAKNAMAFFVKCVEADMFVSEKIAPQRDVAKPKHLLDARVRSVFVIGGETGETNDVEAERPRLHRAAIKIGKILAGSKAQLIVCSPFGDSADYYTAMGYADGNSEGTIQFHSPNHPDVNAKRDLFRATHGRQGLLIQDWNYPQPETGETEAWYQAWLLAQLQALDRAEIVVALGGKVSQTANTLIHLAEMKGLPIVPYAFLGGSAMRAFARRNWEAQHPGFDPSILAHDNGIESVVEVINRFVSDRLKQASQGSVTPKTVFISHARQDTPMMEALEKAFRARNIEVLVGDKEMRADQLIPASIEQAILRSDTCVVLWSRYYALSPWCHDELSIALDRHAYAGMKIWLFNLDDSAVVHKQARNLPAISIRHVDALSDVLKDLLSDAPLSLHGDLST